VLQIPDDLPQFCQVDDVRSGRIGLGLARRHRGGDMVRFVQP
jgi:hypothetical protein